MRRVFSCFVWAIVFFCLFAVAISLTTTTGAKAQQERERLAKQAGEKYALLVLFGPIGLSIVLSAAGVLPGTGRRKQAEPAAVAATSPEPGAVGSSEYPFTFAGFWDRWSRIGQGAMFFGGLGLFFMAAGSRSAQQQVVWVGGGFAALGLLILLFLLYRMGMLLEVRLSTEGITWSGMLGSRHRTWEQIANVYRAETLLNRRYRTRDLRLEFCNGGTVTIDQSITDF
jgi:hypothetical protein